MRERTPIPISVFLSKIEADQQRLVLEARREYGHWLNEFIWSHFITLTFGRPLNECAVVQNFYRWIRHLERRQQHCIGWFYVVERGSAGHLHLHVLTAHTEELTVSELEWTWRCGRADASVYDPSRPASFYISKDFGLRHVAYDIAPGRKLIPKSSTLIPSLP